ncbi:glyoxylase [Stappia sp. 22II-S9-Z10]|nr:glyoxylase [Stappia sp. 22II-S9-Z10]
MNAIAGLHHVTAICGAPQTNLDFYVRALGQRLVKRTVNFDDPGTYHFYYGDHEGTPGTILTFFPFANAGAGRPGPGMACAVAYEVSPAGFDAAAARLAAHHAPGAAVGERFGQRVLSLVDPDGLTVEIVETGGAGGAGDVPHFFHSVTLCLAAPEPTARLLTDVFGYRAAGEATEADGATRLRFVSGAEDAEHGAVVDLEVPATRRSGLSGAGTIHHVAFRARTDAEQVEWQQRIAAAGFDVTPVIDRQYFNAVYFREPGGVLFEIATDPPGFATDEPVETLGEALKLPAQYEPHRARIEAVLPPVTVPA